ncbi:MAG: hypothetical protein ACE368_06020 [Paracoccaceae bacterium]
MNHRALCAGLAALILPLAGCSVFEGGNVSRATTEITTDGTDGTVYVRSTRPSYFGGLFGGTVVPDPAEARPAEIVAAVSVTPVGETPRAPEVELGAYTPEVAAAPMAFGDVATVCGIDPASRAQLADESAAGYRLYDSAPGTMAAHSYYVTGFADGCARRFTAMMASFGTVAGHEAARYNPLNETPLSETDRLYEALKADVCGAAEGASCSGWSGRALARGTAFLTVYDGFGPDGRWMELLLHDGALVTAAR